MRSFLQDLLSQGNAIKINQLIKQVNRVKCVQQIKFDNDLSSICHVASLHVRLCQIFYVYKFYHF